MLILANITTDNRGNFKNPAFEAAQLNSWNKPKFKFQHERKAVKYIKN